MGGIIFLNFHLNKGLILYKFDDLLDHEPRGITNEKEMQASHVREETKLWKSFFV